jgi:hypothetical protein
MRDNPKADPEPFEKKALQITGTAFYHLTIISSAKLHQNFENNCFISPFTFSFMASP